MRDIVYFYDYKSPYTQYELGEIQREFNFGLVLDGTKDSNKIRVLGFVEETLTPNTIIYHNATSTWWVVKHDRVERYLNEDETFVYIHELDLLGAIDLLNNRDLTDSGFNQKRYTIENFLNRIFSHSNFEYSYNIIYRDLDKDQIVNYVKTYENYTLLSALRDFLNGYNCTIKLIFNRQQTNDGYIINSATFLIYSKCGTSTLPILDIDTFDDVRELKEIDKNSYGTSVISNAENVISTISKTFPAVGAVRLSGTAYKISPENAVLRLPFPVYKGIWLKLFFRRTLTLRYDDGNDKVVDIAFDPTSNASLNNLVDKIKDNVDLANITDNEKQIIKSLVESQDFINKVKSTATITFYEGNSLNPVTGDIVQGDNVPYIPEISFWDTFLSAPYSAKVIFTDEETCKTLPKEKQGMYWKRGSDLIQNFIWLDRYLGYPFIDSKDTDYQSSDELYALGDVYGNHFFHIIAPTNQHINYMHSYFQVKYIPMSDIKIKVDNDKYRIDSQVYNQNGKLTDSVALSKLLNSYSREISSDNITRYKAYYSFDDVPSVGQLVKKGNELYVINNISLDFTQNESTGDNVGYYIEAEISMSEQVAVKSLMSNPNSNIRDYGIPQKFNVKRKQLYRDYVEFDFIHEEDSYQGNPGGTIDSEETKNIEVSGTLTPVYNSYSIPISARLEKRLIPVSKEVQVNGSVVSTTATTSRVNGTTGASTITISISDCSSAQPYGNFYRFRQTYDVSPNIPISGSVISSTSVTDSSVSVNAENKTVTVTLIGTLPELMTASVRVNVRPYTDITLSTTNNLGLTGSYTYYGDTILHEVISSSTSSVVVRLYSTSGNQSVGISLSYYNGCYAEGVITAENSDITINSVTPYSPATSLTYTISGNLIQWRLSTTSVYSTLSGTLSGVVNYSCTNYSTSTYATITYTAQGSPEDISIIYNNGVQASATFSVNGNVITIDLVGNAEGNYNGILNYRTYQNSYIDFSYEVALVPNFQTIKQNSIVLSNLINIDTYETSLSGDMIYIHAISSGVGAYSFTLSYVIVTHAGLIGENKPFVLNLSPTPNGRLENEETGVIELTYENGDKYYYQLDTTKFYMEKLLVEIIDFKDNNIIGYGSQNTNSAFQVSRIFSGLVDDINTPISYVDENGEFVSIKIKFYSNLELTELYDDYQIESGYGNDDTYSLYNYSVFVPAAIFTGLANGNVHEAKWGISEPNYYKDATEVPVFEYSLQIGDNDNVLIGDTILEDYEEDEEVIFMYHYAIGNANTMIVANAERFAYAIDITENMGVFSLDNAVKFEFATNDNIQTLSVKFYNSMTENNGTISYGSQVAISNFINKDIAIYRYRYNKAKGTTTKQLIMIIKNPSSEQVSDGGFLLYVNKYKLN